MLLRTASHVIKIIKRRRNTFVSALERLVSVLWNFQKEDKRDSGTLKIPDDCGSFSDMFPTFWRRKEALRTINEIFRTHAKFQTGPGKFLRALNRGSENPRSTSLCNVLDSPIHSLHLEKLCHIPQSDSRHFSTAFASRSYPCRRNRKRSYSCLLPRF